MLLNIDLDNFRNYKKKIFEFSRTTVLLGPNGAGKTNVLEAVAVASYGRSFREEDKKVLVNYESDYGRVQVELAEDGEEANRLKIEIFIQKSPRLLFRAKEKGVGRRLSDFVGVLPSVVFSPETINIISGAPAERRRFLDIMISQIDHDYLRALSAFTKVRRQRNSLLQRIACDKASEDELKYWDDQLISEAEVIEKKRIEAVAFLNKFLIDLYREISAKREVINLKYEQKSEGNLADKLRDFRQREIAYGGTIYGPHRDDLVFRLDNRDMQNFASRGELRSAILALKVAELKFLEEQREKRPEMFNIKIKPILLLDDIFSEFDIVRRQHLGQLISEYQSLITTTDREHLSSELIKRAKIIEIK